MKGSDVVIGVLERACDSEARAILQYRVDSVILENMGLGDLAKYVSGLMDEEREHLKKLLDRLVCLETSPAIEIEGRVTESPKPRKASPQQIISLNGGLETSAITLYTEGCRTCLEAGDFVTFDIFREILADEQEHLNWIESQLDLIAQIGEVAYIQANISEG